MQTIAAIATPPGNGGLGVVRISGEKALKIASDVFVSASGTSLLTAKGYTAHYGRVRDGGEDNDEVIALVFLSPKSYTGEDVVEISCHGGGYILQRVLRAVMSAGARPALPGEFTKRAFLNGKLSLDEAEAVASLISADSELTARESLRARFGAVNQKAAEIKSALLNFAAHLAVWSDYPDETPDFDTGYIIDTLSEIRKMILSLLSTYDSGRMIFNGVETAIVGKPNSGKSTLMNLLAGFPKSIVTEIPGTTRDVIEEKVIIGGINIRLSDTAGIRETDDMIEGIGVSRSKERLASADLIFAVFDSSTPLDDQDKLLMNLLKDKKSIAVINKRDLPSLLDLELIRSSFDETVYISALSGEGREKISAAVTKVTGISKSDGGGVLFTERQRDALARAFNAINDAIAAAESGLTADAVGVCADESLMCLLELTGERVTEEVVDKVFEKFCVGK